MPPRKTAAKKAASSAAASVFSGQTFCISGKFSRSQAEMKALVTDNGGAIATTPSRACTYLVADALGSAKTEKAVKDGLDIVTEAWLDQSIKDGKLNTDAKLFLSGPNAKAGAADMEDEAKPEEEEEKPAAGSKKKAAPKKAAAKAGSKRKAAAADDEEEAAAPAADAPAADAAATDAPAADAAASAAAATPAADEPASAAPAKKARVAPVAAAPAAAPVVPSFAGKKFLVMGGFTQGKFKVESQIQSLGGEIASSVLKSLSYCVCGTPVSTDYGGVSGPGSKKHKEAKKVRGCVMLNEDQFNKLVEEIKAVPAAGAAGGPPAEPEDVGSYADLVADLRAILKLLEIEDKDLVPATDAEITACEADLQMSLPGPLRALLRIVNGSSSLASSEDVPHLFPSTEEISELFNYNDAHATVFRSCRWIPYYMIDYDFAWLAMDRSSGMVYCCDLECNSFDQLGYTMAGKIAQYRQWLTKHMAKKAAAAAAADKAAAAAAAGEPAAPTPTAAAAAVAPAKAAEDDDDDSFDVKGVSSRMPHALQVKINKAYRDM